MAKFEKTPVKKRGRNAREIAREMDQHFQTRATQGSAARIINRLERPDKKIRYRKDMELLARAGNDYRGEVAYNPLGNKKLKIEKEGELTREHGVLRKTRKIQKLGKNEEVYIGPHEVESWRTKTVHEFDAKSELTGKTVAGKSVEEKWGPDENGKLIRRKFSTSRFGDVGFGSAVSEDISDSFERNGKKYRYLTRRKGKKETVFLRDEKNGNLKLRSHKSGRFSKVVETSENGDIERVKIDHGGKFSKSYISRLVKDDTEISGFREIGRDLTSVRRLWDNRSAVYDDETGKMTSAKHTLGKLYKSKTLYGDGGVPYKYTVREVLGWRLLPARLKALSAQENADQKLRADEAAQHKAAWSGIVVRKTPSAGTTKQLGSPAKQPELEAAAAAVAPKDEQAVARTETSEKASRTFAADVTPEEAEFLSNWKRPVKPARSGTSEDQGKETSIKSRDNVSVFGDYDTVHEDPFHEDPFHEDPFHEGKNYTYEDHSRGDRTDDSHTTGYQDDLPYVAYTYDELQEITGNATPERMNSGDAATKRGYNQRPRSGSRDF
ncbi:MAG: effector protein [Mesorhizobium sp.]|uniref:effector protein n=1 Tax=Mesorhizobium sp. TaxID=1871066 RepID=UPI000FE4E480|nr:effector protein [Mesorhizobium sp.]RWI50533.1 MAG: effector protein [Mesorhizobium sp.]